ncbi:hypothetical protein QJQ45_024526 [Haematococcus lacustris]|nr:hypothetical protein QJQ45_024526 [Haematococcus lacustris]
MMAGPVVVAECDGLATLQHQPRPQHQKHMPAPTPTLVASSVTSIPQPHKVFRRKYRQAMSWDSLGHLAKAALASAPTTPWSAVKWVFARLTLMLRLTGVLLSYLGLGYHWAIDFWRFVAYTMLLLPGFLPMIVFYFFSPRVIRNVAYGSGPRQTLDWYLPRHGKPCQRYPVVIYVTGGAWSIGYKAWGAILAERLSAAGALVATIDYRNFPQGNALDMLQDVNTGISWICSQCGLYGGDPGNVVLVGQSAGGHLATLALMRQAEQRASGVSTEQGWPAWDPTNVRAFICVSGAYDMAGLADHLRNRGLYRDVFAQVLAWRGAPSMAQLSPLRVARSWASAASPAAFMPSVMLVHGTADKSVPCSQARALHEALVQAGVDSTCRLVKRATHTLFLLEGPMLGGKDPLMELMLPVIFGQPRGQEGSEAGPLLPTLYRQLCPAVLCTLAGLVCPF